MLQIYRGRIEKGRFVPVEAVAIPDMTEVYLVVEGRMLEQSKTLAQRQNEALMEFSAAMKEITDEPLTTSLTLL
jgi:hypothetical protein